MDDIHHHLILLDGESVPDKLDLEIGGGQVVAYTGRAPDKDTENQDAVAIIPYGPDAAVLVVADGAGGLPAGRRASQTAVATLDESLQLAASQTMLLRTAILNGIEAANAAVLELANGSATTMTVVTIEGRIARTYQIGDSEALITGQRGVIRAQTMAHSPTGFAVEAGFLGEREAQQALDSIIKLATHRMIAEPSQQPSKPDDLSIILFRKAARPKQVQ